MRVAISSVGARALRALRRTVADVPAELAWVVRGRAAIERCHRDRPDVLLLFADDAAADIVREMRRVSEHHSEASCPVLLLVDEPERRVHSVYAAIEAGASDVARTPRLVDGALCDPDRLVTRLRARRRKGLTGVAPSTAPLFLIAASVGGPVALARVLSKLDTSVPARILVVQHMDPEFVPGLAGWITERAGRPVELAEDACLLDTACVRLVRSDHQATLDASGRVHYEPLDPADPHSPSINRLFESCANIGSLHGVAALLTGMGEDGARGLLALRRAGWTTFAQDSETSAVFGMPRAAADLGAATRVLGVDAIAGAAAAALAAAGAA